MTEITDTPVLDGYAVPPADLRYDANLRATALNFAHNPSESPAQVIERADRYYAFLCGVTPAV